jgi:tetratricopeptide (TPR) repeat protein
MRPRFFRAVACAAALFSFASLGACGAPAPMGAADPLEAMRREAATQPADGEAAGRLLLGELLAPGGSAAKVIEARKRLDALGPAAQKGLFASLARAVDDEGHGRFRAAALAHIDSIAAARISPHPDAPLVAWFAANHLINLRSSVANLWAQGRDVVLLALDHPGHIGWRARSELVEWWTLDGFREAQPAANAPSAGDAKGDPKAEAKGDSKGKESERVPGLLEMAAQKYGCVDKARVAGPFGHLSAPSHRVHFEAERAGPWPAVFTRDPLRLQPPRLLPTERTGCAIRGVGASGGGIFYIETYIDLPADREMIIAAQAALALFVDDTEVLTRDTRQWGIWPRFGARLRLEAGRHRILARVAGPESSIRLLANDGSPLDLQASDDPAPPYSIKPPVILADPNLLDPFLTELGVPPQKGTPRPERPRDTHDPVSRMLAAGVAHIEGQNDLSSVLFEPLVKDGSKATGPALAMQAVFLEKDPVFPQADARDMTKDVRARAAAKDPELWWPRFWLALDEADKAGMPEVAPKLVELADHFREVPDILKGLGTIYGRIGWKVEQEKAVKEAAARFPDDIETLGALLHLDDEQGKVAEADQLAVRIRALDPDSEVDFERALSRRDFKAAIKELERLGRVRKDRRDIAARIADMLTRAALSRESMQKLEAAVSKKPEDGQARLSLADARFAGGDKGALEKALVDSIQAGADTGAIREAIELIDGSTELSPYRIDGRKIIAEYEASKTEMPGTAARVLDYSAIWIHPDGSARMLEHEIIGIQSREGIQEHAEQRPPRGLVLKIRTIKRDGRILEPEIVEGKQTITMPHLEVGDYIETESVTTLRSDGQGGLRFEGPRWFFREEKIPYWRSEFITISPKSKPLDVEIGGPVPSPQVSETGALIIRRYRVDQSPALPEEPASAPIQEFLPNVRIGWGFSLDDTIARMIDAASDETPRDPRLVRVAESIVQGTAPAARPAEKVDPKSDDKGDKGDDKDDDKGDEKAEKKKGDAPALMLALGAPEKAREALSVDEKARRIYRWVAANVEAGRESDGRRIVLGKSGNRTEAFLYLCRLSGIEAELGMVRDRLAPPPTGPMSEAESYGSLAVRVTTDKGSRWMVVRDKFAPYGYLPSAMRGQPAIALVPGAPRSTTAAEGSNDAVLNKGSVELASDGSATLSLDQRYEGKLAIMLRTALETLPDARLKETIEARLLPQSLPGARVLSVEVKNLAEIDEPLILSMKLEMSTFARARPGELVISPPFPMHLGGLAELPSRETPLYISEQISTRVGLDLTIHLPKGATVSTPLEPGLLNNEGRLAKVSDRATPGLLVFDRQVDLPAGRVLQADYEKFQTFARKADTLLHRDVVITLPAR